AKKKMTRDSDDAENNSLFSDLVNKVDDFTKYGQKQAKDQPLKALEAFRNAYHCAMSLGHQGYMQRACAFNLGAALIASRNYSEGLKYLKQAKLPENQDGDLYFNFGLAFKGLKNITKSKYYFKKALELYDQKPQNSKMLCETHQLLYQLCLDKEEYHNAEDWLMKLIELYTTSEQTEKLLIAKMERAKIFVKKDRHDSAEEIADKCLEKAKKMDVKENTVKLLNEIALVFCQLKKYDKALLCYQHYNSATQNSNSPNLISPNLEALIAQNMGALYNQMEKFEESLKYHQKALSKLIDLGLRRSQGHVLINLGYAFSQLKNIKEAGDHYLEALRLAKETGDKKSEWQCYESLGAVAYNTGSKELAQKYYKQALEVFLRSSVKQDKSIQDRILGKLTNIVKLQIEDPRNNSTNTRAPGDINRNQRTQLNEEEEDEMDVDAEDIEDKKQVRRELAKLKSNIELEREMDSTSSDFDSDKSSVKKKSRQTRTYEKPRVPDMKKKRQPSGTYDMPNDTIPPTFKPDTKSDSIIKSLSKSIRPGNQTDSDGKNSLAATKELSKYEPGTSKRAKISDEDLSDSDDDISDSDDDVSDNDSKNPGKKTTILQSMPTGQSEEEEDEMDVDAEDIEDKKQVRRELAKLIKSNIELEREMDSTSSDYDEIDSDTDSNKSSVKEKSRQTRTYEKPRVPDMKKKRQPSGTYDMPNDTIPPTFKPDTKSDSIIKSLSKSIRPGNQTDSDGKNSLAATKELSKYEPGTSKRAKISDEDLSDSGDDISDSDDDVSDSDDDVSDSDDDFSDNDSKNPGKKTTTLQSMPTGQREKVLYKEHLKLKQKPRKELQEEESQAQDNGIEIPSSKTCLIM
ncbi:AT-rich interactive domain-containing protein 4A isoform X1, partial [Biomphalaria pfeifferi]